MKLYIHDYNSIVFMN